MANNHKKSFPLLFAEIIKGVEELYKDQPKTLAKLKNVFLYFKEFEAQRLDGLSKWISPKNPFRCVETGFKDTRNDGEIMVTPEKNMNNLVILLNDRKISDKIKRGEFSFSFRIYVNLGYGFPYEDLNF